MDLDNQRTYIYGLRNFRNQFAPNSGEIFGKNIAYFLGVTSWSIVEYELVEYKQLYRSYFLGRLRTKAGHGIEKKVAVHFREVRWRKLKNVSVTFLETEFGCVQVEL